MSLLSELVEALRRGDQLSPEMSATVADYLIFYNRELNYAKEYDVRYLARKMKEKGTQWRAEEGWVLVDRDYFWKMAHTQ